MQPYKGNNKRGVYNNMKKQYETPFMETVEFNYEDMVITSLGGSQQGSGNSENFGDIFQF